MILWQVQHHWYLVRMKTISSSKHHPTITKEQALQTNGQVIISFFLSINRVHINKLANDASHNVDVNADSYLIGHQYNGWWCKAVFYKPPPSLSPTPPPPPPPTTTTTTTTPTAILSTSNDPTNWSLSYSERDGCRFLLSRASGRKVEYRWATDAQLRTFTTSSSSSSSSQEISNRINNRSIYSNSNNVNATTTAARL
jgi:hypothetical protein